MEVEAWMFTKAGTDVISYRPIFTVHDGMLHAVSLMASPRWEEGRESEQDQESK